MDDEPEPHSTELEFWLLVIAGNLFWLAVLRRVVAWFW
jgi:hypothetical protein